MITYVDLSNDSYSTVNLGIDEGTSPHSLRGSCLHGNSSPSQPFPSSRSPPTIGHTHSYGSYPDNIVYTSVGKYLWHFLYPNDSNPSACDCVFVERGTAVGLHGSGNIVAGGGGGGGGITGGTAGVTGGSKPLSRLHGGSAISDLSNDSSVDHAYPDFPPSPDSWLGDAANSGSNQNTASAPAVRY